MIFNSLRGGSRVNVRKKIVKFFMDRPFYHEYILRAHYRSPTGEKPFKCSGIHPLYPYTSYFMDLENFSKHSCLYTYPLSIYLSPLDTSAQDSISSPKTCSMLKKEPKPLKVKIFQNPWNPVRISSFSRRQSFISRD